MADDEKRETATDNNRPLAVPDESRRQPRRWRGTALVFFCFVAGALGAAVVVLAQGDLQRTITNSTTREVVSSESQLIADIVDTLSPSTVSITTTSLSQDAFFGPAVQQGAGTGIITSKDGYVMTNSHVIPEGVESVTVVMSDGKEYKDVRVVGRDSLNDIAFLKIEDGNNFTPAPIGESSEMEVGQKVIALGNALGQFQNTVTTGVISGISRPITASDGRETEQLHNLFQTDAAINPGNSGGPLVNLDGKVIGINTAVAEGAEGIGFAIPIDDVKGLITSVSEQGKLIRPYLGVRAVNLTPAIAEQLGIETQEGAYVVTQDGVLSGSPADKAGVQPEDIITAINGDKITSRNGLSSVIAQHRVGDELTLTIIRDDEEMSAKATLQALPDNF